MITYKAMYKEVDKGYHGEVLDFPGVITWGATLDEARRLLSSALADLAETHLASGESIPTPVPDCTDPEADLEEPIHLLIKATAAVELVPQNTVG